MREKIKVIVGLVLLNLVIYPFGILLALVFLTLRATKYVKVFHWERFPHFKEKTILVANHPSMFDPFLVAAMFFKAYLISPTKHGPLLVSDKSIFYDSWYWFWLRPFLIPVNRKDKRSGAASFIMIKNALEQGRVVIIFPEGGRTFRGDKFLYSKKGKFIRILEEGVALLVRKTGATVVPVWIEGTEKFLPNSDHKLFTGFKLFLKKSMHVKIGNPLYFTNPEPQAVPSRAEIIQTIANALLQLADEEET